MRIYILAALLLSFTSCVHQADLQSPDGKSLGIATIESDGNHSGKITLVRNDHIFKGNWASTKVDESRQIAKSYGVNSRRYVDYQRGLGSYLHEATSVLKSDQGNVLTCVFKYRGITAKGSCQSETDSFEFTVKS